MRLRKRLLAGAILWLALLVPVSFGSIGCEEGPAEEAGEEVDDATDEAEDALDE